MKISISTKVFLFILLVYLTLMSGHFGGDSLYVYLTSESLLVDGNLNLNDHAGREFGVKELQNSYNHIFKSAGSSPLYSKYLLGEPLVFIPFYLFGLIFSKLYQGMHPDYITVFFVSMANCFISALLCFVFFKLLGLFSISRKTALLFTFGLAFGTIVFAYSRQGFREPLTALSVILSIYSIILFSRTGNFKRLTFAGIFLGYAVFTRVDSIYLLPSFILFLYLHDQRINKFLKSATLFTIPVFLFTAFDLFIIIETSLILAAADAQNLNLNPVYIIDNIYGILVSSGKSIFIYSPLTVLYFFSIRQFHKEFNKEALLLTTIIASNILFYSLFLGYFVGGTSWGPRFQYTIIPLMLIPAAYKTIKFGLNKKMFYTLLIAGIFTQIPTIFVNSGQMLHALQAELEKTSYMGAWELTAFTPRYSPIILGYMQITSAIKSSLGFQSVSLVLTDIYCANLGQISIGSIDYWDLWFTNIMRIGGSVILKLTVVSILLIELAAIVYIFKSLTTGAKDS